MRSSDKIRFRLNALPQRQETWSSTYPDQDDDTIVKFNYISGASKVNSWDKIDHREVKNLNC